MRSHIRLLLPLLALLSSPALAADKYEFDKAHTNILFHVSHMGFSDMIGFFKSYDGGFTFDPDHPEQSTIDVTLHPSSIATSSSLLDLELQSSKFFNTMTYPDIHFVSTEVKITGKQTGDVTGNLTLLGVTRPVVLHVHFNRADYSPVTSLYVAGFSAGAVVKRSDFGMNNLVPMVGDDVRIEIQTEGVNINRKQAEKLKH